MKPFLKWAGGKRWLVAKWPEILQRDGHRLIEPFLGSGAVFFHLEPETALLADRNAELIETYAAIREDYTSVLTLLRSHHTKHSTLHYYRVRDSRPRSQAARAARLIYLNRTCFNGLYRVNLKGEFNVPIGSKNTVVFPDDDFEGWARVLRGADLRAQDFAPTIQAATSGDLIYADPPYTVKHNMNNFVKYNEHIFSWDDQLRLKEALVEASKRGAAIVMSNADHPSIRELYSGKGWTQITLSRFSRLAGDSAHRVLSTEVIIANCIAPKGEWREPRHCT